MRGHSKAAEDAELKRLIEEQEADDTDTVRPERHGGDHGQPVLSLDALPENTKAHPLWADRGLETNDVVKVRHVIEQAPEEQREVFRLVYDEQLTQREAADQLGISQSAVRDRLARLQKRVAREVLS